MKRYKKIEATARSKVVVRHLPPSLSRSDFFGLIDSHFADRYSWTSFRPGKISSRKGQWCSRAYIHFKKPEDVADFAGLFGGHIFVNEKGAHFKTIVEYSPSQRVPMPCAKDAREGTIYKDPDYLEFLKLIAMPVEKLRKPAIQLEAIDVERAEEIPVVTPLMEFVRQKRAGTGVEDPSAVGKTHRKSHTSSKGKLASVTIKHGQSKKKNALEESKKDSTGKDKLENANKILGTPKVGKKKILLLKGKEPEVPEGEMTSSVNPTVSIASKQSHLLDSRDKLIRTILLNNEAHQSSSSVPSKKIKPKILDNRKQLNRTAEQSVNKELPAADNIHDNIHEKPAKIGVESAIRSRENVIPSPGQNMNSLENGHNTKNEHYRRKENVFMKKTNVKFSKRTAHEKQVWVQKSSPNLGK